MENLDKGETYQPNKLRPHEGPINLDPKRILSKE
jgi:hypothetical protein